MRTRRTDSALAAAQILIPARGGLDPLPAAGADRSPQAVLASPLIPKMKPRAVMLSMPGRCAEKGCVFPAVPGSGGRCIHHQRQQQEPGLYSSYQPSSALVARGKFGPARIEEGEPGPSRGRGRDRRRMMMEREHFLNE